MCPRPITAEKNLKKGDEKIALGEYSVALSYYDLSIEYNPRDLRAHYAKGSALNALKQYAEAIKVFDHVIRENTSDYLTYKSLNKKGLALAKLGKIDEALEAQEASLKVSPNVAAYCHKGILLYKLDQDEKALECFDMARDLEFAPSPLAGSTSIAPSEHRIFVPEALDVEKTLQSRADLRKKFLELQETTSSGIAAVSAISKEPTESSSPIVVEAVSKFKDLLTRSKKMSGAVIIELGKPKVMTKESEDKISALEAQIADMHKKMQNLVSVLESVDSTTQRQQDQIEKLLTSSRGSGIEELARIKHDFKELKGDSLEYCTTFYWSVINLMSAYRNISTGMIEGNVHAETRAVEAVLVFGVKKSVSVATEFAKGIPFVGCVVSALDKVIDILYDAYKTQKMNNKIDAIKHVITGKFHMEDDISRNIANVALEMTKIKEAEIRAGDLNTSNSGWLIKIIMSLLSGEDESKSHGVKLALKDAAIFISHLCESHIKIASAPEPFDELVRGIAMTISGLEIEDASHSFLAITQGAEASNAANLPEGTITEVFASSIEKSDSSQSSVATIRDVVVEIIEEIVQLPVGLGFVEKVESSSCWCC
ncbi:MAG: tetratricopeptide repeat protein [Pseudomonadota bacterium]